MSSAGDRSSRLPTEAQRRYLSLGLRQPGGKLPLFDSEGQEIRYRTIQACVERGWAEPWIQNPIKTEWLVCRLTDEGRDALDREVSDHHQPESGTKLIY